MRFEGFDPRPNNPAANETNEKIFSAGPVLGIEVTVPALAARCALGNIDPQHTGGNKDLTAIEVALTAELPSEKAVLATVRADLDSIGAMAVIALRAEGILFTAEMCGWVYEVAKFDTFANGPWPGRQPLPNKENPWPEKFAHFAGMAMAVADFKLPLSKRVDIMKQFICFGVGHLLLKEYDKRAEVERMSMIEALEKGQIKVDLRDRLVIVESGHRAAISPVGYSFAPVVVALNPEFSFQGGAKHRKFTIAQYKAGYVDMKAVMAELAKLEAGWGGSPTIGGSPQGVSSVLTVDQVVEVVEKYLK
jgi:hypothetical protein